MVNLSQGSIKILDCLGIGLGSVKILYPRCTTQKGTEKGVIKLHLVCCSINCLDAKGAEAAAEALASSPQLTRLDLSCVRTS
jgi:hypothetical protein